MIESMRMSDAKDHDEYLADCNPEAKRALAAMRAFIHGLVPEAEECMYYRVPAFRLNGPLVGFAAFNDHYSFFPFNGHTVAVFENELKGYETGKGTIHLDYDKPIPEKLIGDIVAFRVEENLAKPVKKKK